MTADLDALIAVLRKGDGNGCRQPTEAMRTAAEYLDELRAELRQERERAELVYDAYLAKMRDLSRAEETIEKVRDILGGLYQRPGSSGEVALRIITEYGKQKEADRG